MSDELKREMENIKIPNNLQEHVLKDVQRAKLETSQEQPKQTKRQSKPYLISLLAVAVIGMLILPSIQSLDMGNEQSTGDVESEKSQGAIVSEELTDGDSHVTEEMHEMISDYIIGLHQQNEAYQTDVQFEVHKVFGTLNEGEITHVYMWSYFSSYNVATGKEEVSGASTPVTITFQKLDGTNKITHFEEARDGSLYLDSLVNMFPDKYVDEALNGWHVKELHEEMQQKVDSWFNEVSKEKDKDKDKDKITTESNIFELTSEEAKAYHKFQQDLNTNHLDGLSPLNIARLYIFAGYEKKYDVQYALYTDRVDYIMWSEEEHLNFPESERGSIDRYININEGTFVETSDHTGYIKFYIDGELMSFQMIKNEDGIWQVAFMPLQ